MPDPTNDVGEESTAFEAQLRRSLARVNAPETMAAFLLRAAEVEAERGRPWHERKHRWAFATPALATWRGLMLAGSMAAVVVAGIGAEHVRRRHEATARTVLATQQFETADRITQQTLEHTREQLRRAGVALDE